MKDAKVPAWKERLVFDFEISDSSPVIRGTWVTVNHIVELIVDGRSWSDILRMHPELDEEDIRAATAWALSDEVN